MAARLLCCIIALNCFMVTESLAQTAATPPAPKTHHKTAGNGAPVSSLKGSAATSTATVNNAAGSKETREKRHKRMKNPHQSANPNADNQNRMVVPPIRNNVTTK